MHLNVCASKIAFTLAEVLITLGIIGVVAALTLPTLIQSHTNKVVETRLQKFYSVINQAVQRAEADFGDKKDWAQSFNSLDQYDKPVDASVQVREWFDTYLKPYLNISKIENDNDNGTFFVYFSDGSAMASKNHTNGDWYFYPGNPKTCLKKYDGNIAKAAGSCVFEFQFKPNNTNRLHNKGFEPYQYAWDGTEAGLYNNDEASYTGCNETKRAYCTALIWYNNWKIPKDYPVKVSY